MRAYGCYVFDLDGTIYRGDVPIPGAVEALKELRARNAKVLFATNNSSATEGDYVNKLRRMGIRAETTDILTSGRATARYCINVAVRRVMVIGEPGLVETLESEGVSVVNFDGSRVQPNESAVDAVVVGICRAAFSYDLLDSAMQALTRTGRLIGTNGDATYPQPGDRFAPGAGTILAAVATASGLKPTIIGKPNPYMLLHALQSFEITASDTVMIGDRIDTDIRFAQAAGCHPILVTTGVDKKAPEGVTAIGSLMDLL